MRLAPPPSRALEGKSLACSVWLNYTGSNRIVTSLLPFIPNVQPLICIITLHMLLWDALETYNVLMKCALPFKQDLNYMLQFGIKLISKQRTFCAEETEKKATKNKKRCK